MAKKAAKKTTPARAARRPAPRAAEPPKDSATIEEVRKLITLMVDHDLSELNIEEGSKKILLKRGGSQAPAPMGPPALAAPALAAPATPSVAPDQAEELIEVKSPMVGTFYTASSPDGEALVAVGDPVEPDDVVCIVEAMKVMNEIKADCAGAIAELCVKNTQPVEFGQTLFRVRPF